MTTFAQKPQHGRQIDEEAEEEEEENEDREDESDGRNGCSEGQTLTKKS